jgi:hypothetical protein
MTPTHIPFIVSVMCSSIQCDDMPVVQDMIRSNLGPLLSRGDHIACSRMHTGLVECDVYAPWKTSCACCKQLKDTFTSDVLSSMLEATVDGVEVNCELPARYIRCDAVRADIGSSRGH